jgi:F-type H+-transporting ATPase subunit alpha
LSASEQIIVLLAVNQGIFDRVPEEKLDQAETLVRNAILELPDRVKKIDAGETLSDEDLKTLHNSAEDAVADLAQT